MVYQTIKPATPDNAFFPLVQDLRKSAVESTTTNMSLLTQLAKSNLPTTPASRKVVPIKARKTAIKKSKKNQKKVRFAPKSTVNVLQDVTQQDLDNSWYHPAEYNEFDNDRKCTVEAVRLSGGDLRYLDPERWTVRGLEQQLSTQQVLARKIKTMQYTRLVLEQQHHQRCVGISDPGAISAVSCFFSKQAGNRAHLRAVIDHALSSEP